MAINEDPILGTPQDDYLPGTSGDDDIQGLGGDDQLDGGNGNDTLSGGAGDDSLYGGNGNDTLEGGSGSDALYGGNGNDTYLFGRGSGHDRIDNYDYLGDGQDLDVIQLGAGIAPSDIRIEVDGTSLIIRINGTTDSLRIENHFMDGGSSGDYAIDEIRFADGTVWDKAYLVALQMTGTNDDQYIYGTSGDDTIYGLGGNDVIEGRAGNDTLDGGSGNDELRGGQGNDILIGGAGNDRMVGGEGNDIYRFARGSGNDVIDNSGSGSTTDVIELDAGIASGDVRITAEGSSLIIHINGTTDTLRVENHFSDESYYGIDQVKFADGTIWDKAYLFTLQMAGSNDSQSIYGTSGDDTLLGLGGNDDIDGRNGNDTLDGGSGSDELQGSDGNDILIGGTGDDVLSGGDGDDIYRFQLGDGQDRIENFSYLSDNDVIEFGSGVAPTDLIVAMEGDSLFIRLAGSSDSIEIANYNSGGSYYDYRIDAIKFADGTVWDKAYIQTLQMRGLDIAQNIVGSGSGDTIDALGGDDLVSGLGGNDIIEGGDGNDWLNGDTGDDSLSGGAGSDTLYGGAGNDILAGGAGNDTMRGEIGNDVYRFGRGDGQDSIYNYDEYYDGEDFDVIELGAGIAPEDIELERQSLSLVIRIAGTNDSLTIYNFFDQRGYADYEIDEIRFADGTVWTKAYLYELQMRGTDDDQHLTGTIGNDMIDAKGGNDQVEGMAGDDTLIGGAGGDSLYGGEGNDILIGGSGDDWMQGGSGDDIYRLEAGFGSDFVNQDSSYGFDSIEFGPGLSPDDALVSRDWENLIISFAGTNDRVVVYGFFSESSDRKIDQVAFADGTVWDVAELVRRHLLPNEDNQYMFGTADNDVLDGGGGSDRLYGKEGDDHLIGGTGSDTLDGEAGDDTLEGGDDSDALYGRDGADTLIGGRGNDDLAGGDGADVYRFSLGDGYDEIQEEDNLGNGAEIDAIELGAGIPIEDVVLRRDGGDLVLEVLGTSDAIRIKYYFYLDSYDRRIDEIRFADGTVWTETDILARALTPLSGTGNDDTLEGTAQNDLLDAGYGDDAMLGRDGDDVLLGGGGNDLLEGGEGNDQYLLDAGFGADTIRNFDDHGNGIDTDVVRFGAGIFADDLTAASAGDDLIVTNAVTGDVLTFAGFFAESADGNSDGRIDAVKFDDGTTWTADELILKQMHGTEADQTVHGRSVDDTIDAGAGHDVVYAHDGDDILIGGLGDDRLGGGRGSDEYRFESGWGRDVIENAALGATGQDIDAVVFGAGILPDEILVASNGLDLVLTRASTGDSVTVSGFFAYDGSDAAGRIQQVRFADGTVWDIAELIARQMVGNDADQYLHGSAVGDSIDAGYGNDNVYGHQGDDTILGGDGDDVIDGGAGTDSLDGGEGNDFFVFGRGSGRDRVLSRDEYGQYYDIVQIGAGVSPSEISLHRRGNDLEMRIAGTNDALTIKSFFPLDAETGYPDAIDEIWFTDGTVWDVPYLLSSVRPYISGTGGVDTLIGTVGGEDIEAGAGDDFINAGAGDDILIGGAGNDRMIGAQGNDEYYFDLGWGHDSINNADNFVDGVDTADSIRFGEGIRPQDILVSHSGTDETTGWGLMLTHAITGDTIYLQNYFNDTSLAATDFKIDEIRFEDGTVWTIDDVRAMLSPEAWESRIVGAGTAQNPTDAGIGDDKVQGSTGNDVLIGGAGNDLLLGGTGDDVFRFGPGWGHDRIKEINSAMVAGFDTIEFGAGIAPTDIAVRQNPANFLELLIENPSTGDVIVVDNFFSQVGLLGADQLFDQIRFADGTIWTLADVIARALAGTPADQVLRGTRLNDTVDAAGGDDQIWGGRGNDTLSGGEGNDVLFGEDGNDILNGGAGDDTLSGGAFHDVLDGGDGNDLFRFEVGTSSDTVRSQDPNGQYTDAIVCGQGIAPEDLVATRVGDDLVLTNASTLDAMTVQDYFASGGAAHPIDEIRFADGTVWDTAHIVGLFEGPPIVGTAGDDTLYGTDKSETIDAGAGNDSIVAWRGDDILIGGAGDDFLMALQGDDEYVFELGWGHDTVSNEDNHLDGLDVDVIRFGAGIGPQDIVASHVVDALSGSYDLVLTHATTGDSVKVEGYFSEWVSGTTDKEIDQIRFADGTVWTRSDLQAMFPPDVWASRALFGTAGNDVLIGGAGNDLLIDGAGDDVLRFEAGWGHDQIGRGYSEGAGFDTIEFGAGISIADIVIRQNPANYSNLLIEYTATGDTIEVKNYFSSQDGQGYDSCFDQIRFADGTIWNQADVLARVFAGTEADQYLVGTRLDDTIDAAGGNDQVSGNAGNDTLSGGTGSDVLSGGTGNDSLDGGAGNDALYGNEGDDTVSGGAGDDYLGGEGGSDVLDGGDGNDTFYFELGTGSDVIHSQDAGGLYTDGILVDQGVVPADLDVQRVGDDLVLTIIGTQDSLTVKDFFVQAGGGAPSGIDEVRFNNGTVWDVDYIMGLFPDGEHIVGTSGGDTLQGTADGDLIDALGGSDSIFANDGNDTIVGGAGDDYIYGGEGNDTYRYELGWGADTIDNTDNHTNGAGTEIIEFGAGIASTDIKVGIDNTDLLLTHRVTGETIRILYWEDTSDVTHPDYTYHIDEFRFADGTVWTEADVIARLMIGDDTDQQIPGTQGDDTIEAKGGNDGITGKEGNDTIDAGQGNDVVFAGDGNDVLTGGAGDDTLFGDGGNDLYLYQAGWGHDTIYDFDSIYYPADDINIVRFGEGIAADDILVSSPDGSELLLTHRTTGDSIHVINYAKNSAQDGHDHSIDQIQFADGTVWGSAELEAWLTAGTAANQILVGSGVHDLIDAGAGDDRVYGNLGNDVLNGEAGDDQLIGGFGADTLHGGIGNDVLMGGQGNDVYRFELGGGQDTVIRSEDPWGTLVTPMGNDALSFGTGINPGDITVFMEGANLVVANTTNDDVVKVEGFPYTYQLWNGTIFTEYTINEIRFADGTTWNVPQILAMLSSAGNDALRGSNRDDVINGLDGNDTISGNGGNDVLDGGLGDDVLDGGTGNDTYKFSLGQGQDHILYYDQAADGLDFDVLELGAGILPAHVGLVSEDWNLAIRFIGSTDQVIVDAWSVSGTDGSNHDIEGIRFADGTFWDKAYINSHMTFAESPGPGPGGEESSLYGHSTGMGMGGSGQIHQLINVMSSYAATGEVSAPRSEGLYEIRWPMASGQMF